MPAERIPEEELAAYNKEPETEWWRDRKAQTIDEKDVWIEQVSPYKIPWNTKPTNEGGDGPRPKDYFDKQQYTLNYTDEKHRDITILVGGTSRHENIKVLVDGQELNFSEKSKIFSMAETFEIDQMFLLEQIINNKRLVSQALTTEGTDNQYIAPYIEVYDNSEDQAKASLALKAITEPYISKVKKSGQAGRLILPIVTRANKSTTGHHWFTCVVDLDQDGTPTVSIINSTHEMKSRALPDILDDYHKKVVQNLNQVFAKLELAQVDKSQIRYSQGLQYGEMGCGITASLNMQSIVTGAFNPGEKAFQNSDQQTQHIKTVELFVLGEDEPLQLSPEDYQKVINGELKLDELTEGKEVLGHKNVEYDKVTGLTDKSARSSVVLEALRRTELGLRIAKREELAPTKVFVDRGNSVIDQFTVPPEVKVNYMLALRELQKSQDFRIQKAETDTGYSVTASKPKL